ncbi:metallophosphoesterase [Clostridium sp. MSJ-11]|uniref:Metallophosphoesterase n=1 Tax=Clostridium mobile TaxID=2841512 RepID=A0ABS6EHM2_9CLOT|nr:metallophosphoesterase [Clostridium mobile]MBU5484699.1 metallophosphoesterase [Clostridium mobile]
MSYISQEIDNAAAIKKNGFILDLSDLQYMKDIDEENEVYLITEDLKKVFFDSTEDRLDLKSIDYIVISGDFVEYGNDEEAFEKAFNFISMLSKECNIPFEKVVIVPGNHDLSWTITMDAYKLAIGTPTATDKVVDNIGNDLFYLKRNDEIWRQKFANYSKFLYEKLYGTPFPPNPKEQLKVITGNFISDRKIGFFMINTSAETDQFNREITYFDLESLIKASREYKDNNMIKIAVGHHPANLVNGYGDDIPFVNALQNEDFKIYLHGHVHRDISLDCFNPQNINPNIIMIGSGALSVNKKGMWPGIPQRYNVIRIKDINDTKKILLTVNTRQREYIGSHWQPAYIYYNEPNKTMSNIWNGIV